MNIKQSVRKKTCSKNTWKNAYKKQPEERNVFLTVFCSCPRCVLRVCCLVFMTYHPFLESPVLSDCGKGLWGRGKLRLEKRG